jgi:predicted transcriptional regulator
MSAVSFSLRLDADTRARLEAEARRVDRPASQVAQRAIARYLDAQEALRRELDAAVAAADEGRFVSAEAVRAWLDTWSAADEAPPPEPDVFLPAR